MAGSWLAGWQRVARLDLVAVVAAVFVLDGVPAAVMPVTMPDALRPVIPG
jgi:hypothetical protein